MRKKHRSDNVWFANYKLFVHDVPYLLEKLKPTSHKKESNMIVNLFTQ